MFTLLIGLCSESRDRRLLQSLQLILLFLPPANRRILHMLLKLLNKTASNNELTLDSEVSNRKLVSLGLLILGVS